MNKIINLTNDSTKADVDAFFRQDVLNFKEFPIEKIKNYFDKPQKRLYEIDISKIQSEVKREEFRDYLKSIFIKGFPFPYTSKQLSYVFRMAEAINSASWKSIFDTKDTDSQNLLDYFQKEKFNGRNNDRHILALLERMKIAIAEYRDTRQGLYRNIWVFSDFNIAPERLNKSMRTNSFNFYKIKNEENRELIKMWYRYLLGNTEYAIGTLIDYLSSLSDFCRFLDKNGNISILNSNRSIVRSYLDSINDMIPVTYNKVVNLLSNLYKFLAIKQTYTNQTPVLRTDYKAYKQEHHNNSVPEYVILQIFSHLHELPFELMLMYLINYSTGLRASDICQLTTNCLIQSEKCYFIRFYIQKMQKDHAVPISTALGELIEKRIAEISKLDYKETYLFFRAPNEPFYSETYRKEMKKWCKKWGIKNEDGTDYNFLTHSYRHTIASSLSQEYDVDLEIIQLVVLGHANPSMSLCYIDESDEYKKMLNDRYVDASGMENSLDLTELIHPGWVKDNLSKQVLPNGICSYPTILGVCPNSDICLNCKYFRTSSKYLDVHKKHLEELEKQIILYESNGWVNNLETTKEQKKKLENIIYHLERGNTNAD